MDATRQFQPHRRRCLLRLIAVVVTTTAISLPTAASAASEPTSPLCDDGSWEQQHPLICDTGGPLPNLGSGGPVEGGRGSDDGLIGRIIRGIGGLL